MATRGSGRGPLIKTKTAAAAPVAYQLVRYEGTSTTSGTPGSSTCIYEIYLFVDGYMEVRFGSWANAGSGISGQYTAAGVGTSFSPASSTSYVWNSSGTSPTFTSSATYQNGSIVAGNALPSLGTTSVASWPPAGYTSLQNASVDDNFVTVTIASTTIMGTARTAAYIGSNAYITFGSGSSLYSGLSTTNPALDKFMFNAADRSYQRVGYLTAGGSK
jgi:hypothetical protein